MRCGRLISCADCLHVDKLIRTLNVIDEANRGALGMTWRSVFPRGSARARRTKISCHGQLADLGVQFLNPFFGICGQTLAIGKQLGGALERLLLPRRDLGGAHLASLCKFGERFIAADGLQSDFSFECW